MITDHNLAQLDDIIRPYFAIEEITYGDTKQPFVTRYRGQIIGADSQE